MKAVKLHLGCRLEFPDTALAQLDNQPAVYPWEYLYTAKSERDSKNLTITSPAQWILTYESGVTLARYGRCLRTRPSGRRRFCDNLLHQCARHASLFIRGHANLIQLFAVLRGITLR